ncbi:MAG: TIGR04282 family arsenosugar biosynthesis glycosyltransferase [Acetobacteraceae bacterium]|nr:TIGR04282 family arsenosugar biosynthesis glycosyltransferase [Acetobacteraceae bacterium]
MKDTVVVFARAPRLGMVKRRLARDIGQYPALRFHRALLERLLQALVRDRRFQTVVAITPDRAKVWVPAGCALVPQGQGDLGMRMARVCRRWPRGQVALIGCDIPEAGPADVRTAFAGLGRADAMFGPAEDGGYWLVAMGPRRPARPFERVRWSTTSALADTLVNFRERRVGFLRVLRDVDTAEDMAKVPRRHKFEVIPSSFGDA